jgi:hypothetical protein
VPLATVKEALAVVLTDLGTRAKNAGRCAHCRCCRTIRSVTLLTIAHTSCSVFLQLVRFPTTPCIPVHVHSSRCLIAVSGSILGANGGDKVRHVENMCVALVVKTCTLPAHAAIHVRICSNVSSFLLKGSCTSREWLRQVVGVSASPCTGRLQHSFPTCSSA